MYTHSGWGHSPVRHTVSFITFLVPSVTPLLYFHFWYSIVFIELSSSPETNGRKAVLFSPLRKVVYGNVNLFVINKVDNILCDAADKFFLVVPACMYHEIILEVGRHLVNNYFVYVSVTVCAISAFM